MTREGSRDEKRWRKTEERVYMEWIRREERRN